MWILSVKAMISKLQYIEQEMWNRRNRLTSLRKGNRIGSYGWQEWGDWNKKIKQKWGDKQGTGEGIRRETAKIKGHLKGSIWKPNTVEVSWKKIII